MGLALTGVVHANKLEAKQTAQFFIRDVTVQDIKPDEKEPEPIPEPPGRTDTVQVQIQRLTQFNVVDDKGAVEPPLTQEDPANAKIDVVQTDGVIDEGITTLQDLDDGKDIIEDKIDREPDLLTKVEADTKFDGNWENFLLRNLNPQTPPDNNAPVGNQTVIIQFVPDIEGTVSEIEALSNLGYGLEQRAIRVLKRATKWEPAIQNGRNVKAYHKQSITFEVAE